MNEFTLRQIGSVQNENGSFAIQLEKDYIPGLRGLEDFSHVMVLWWCTEFDTDEARMVLETPKPYTKGPEVLGIFATRSPLRPNPVAVTVTQLLDIDHQNGVLHLLYIDAWDGTPVLDIKPYTPSSDRVEAPAAPDWCAHWPGSLETSEGFDWEAEFNFEN